MLLAAKFRSLAQSLMNYYHKASSYESGMFNDALVSTRLWDANRGCSMRASMTGFLGFVQGFFMRIGRVR